MKLRTALRVAAGGFLALVLLLAIGLVWRPSLDVDVLAPERAEAKLQGHLHARYFGVSTILVSDGTTSIMVDGFFSRPEWWRWASELTPDEGRIKGALKAAEVGKNKAGKKLDYLLVSHTHHDHALDSATVAKDLGAQLVGSRSMANIAGLSEAEMPVLRDSCSLPPAGQFRIRCFETPHARTRFLFPGVITQPFQKHKLWDYQYDRNYSFLLSHPEGNILIVPSANIVPGQYKGVEAKVVFLSIALLGRGYQRPDFIRTYWKEVVEATGAKLVILIHWDDTMGDLAEPEPLRPILYLLDDVGYTVCELQRLAAYDRVAIRVMRVFEPVLLPPVPALKASTRGFPCS